MRLENKRVVVVGASSGMGLAVVQTAAAEGAKVVMCSRSREKLESARATVRGTASIVPVDATKTEELQQAFKAIGTFDHIVISADATERQRTTFANILREQAEVTMLKFWIAFMVAQTALPYLSPAGSITFFAGVASFRPPRQRAAVIAAANGAIVALGKALALEIAPIRVNVVAPGVVDTGVWDTLTKDSTEAWAHQSLPAQRAATPADIADGVMYLMTNNYTTGSVLFVDGGLMLS